MLTASILVFLGTLCRIVPHPPNAVALGAIALYAGARLPRKWAWIVPITAMILADLFLDWGSGRTWVSGSRWVSYAAYGFITLLGTFARSSSNPIKLGGLSVTATLLFFAASNLGVWAFDGMYPLTTAGLAACFTAAVPYIGTGDYGFFANAMLADLAGTGLLFGVDALGAMIRNRRASAVGAPEPLTAELS